MNNRKEGSEPSQMPGLPGPWLLPVGLALLVFATWAILTGNFTARTLAYSEFKAHLRAGEISECTVDETEITGMIAPVADADGLAPTSAEPYRFRTVRIEDPGLVDELASAGIEYSGRRPSGLLRMLFAWLPLIAIFGLLYFSMMRGAGGIGRSAIGFGKSRAKLVADREIDVDFDDVAGCEEAKTELREVVEFLQRPERFRKLGAKIPHGVLLVGPPGTGKTLMARAVAGEAKVPFFSLSGSDFVEMFVGVGAARVRDLFEQAKQQAPCIVFIDELDAIGRRRGVHMGNVNDEREHTLNQLLVELDGFEPNVGVIILSATNRPDVLDPALLRPGRFDRQVVIDSPNAVGREEILGVHTKNKPLADDVDLAVLARSTPGFSGADLANTVNEAALLAARRGATQITQADLDEAVEKVVAGPERKSRRLKGAEKLRVAIHEVGHALAAFHSQHADPLRKISIVPRGQAALGYTLQLPTGDHALLTRSVLQAKLVGMLGGRAAEELIFGEGSTGAENDLEQATALARQIVCQFGMGKSAGLMHCGPKNSPLLPISDRPLRDCSEATARAVDLEVMEQLEAAHGQALSILEQHRDQLDRAAEALLERETLDGEEFRRILEEAPDRRAAANFAI